MQNERRTRRDREQAQLVDRAVEMLGEVGKRQAARYLVESGVCVRVIARILNEPDRRRRPH